MAMMNLAVVLTRRMLMARSANLVAGVFELGAMRIVAVAALDVLVKHLALQERRVFVHLVHDLAVRVIGGRRQQLVGEIVIVVAAGGVARRDHSPPRMARRTGLNLRNVA